MKRALELPFIPEENIHCELTLLGWDKLYDK